MKPWRHHTRARTHTQDARGRTVLLEKADATAFASAAFSCVFFNSAAARFSGETLASDLARAARGGDAGADMTKALRAPKRPPLRRSSGGGGEEGASVARACVPMAASFNL